MENAVIRFRAKGQNLSLVSGYNRFAGNTIGYIRIEIEPDDEWRDFDSVDALFQNEQGTVPAVLFYDSGIYACNAPVEMTAVSSVVFLNLSGKNVVNNVLVERLTTYPVFAFAIDRSANVTSYRETEVSANMYEQYIAAVGDQVEKITDLTVSAHEADEPEVIKTATPGLPINLDFGLVRGETGEQGIPGEPGSQGEPGVPGEKGDPFTYDDFTEEQLAALVGPQGPRGLTGSAAGFGTVSATVDNNEGDPSVTVATSGPSTAKNINFEFKNLKGDTGATPNLSIGTVETLPPTGSSEVTITGTAENPVLNFKLVKGDTGEVSQAEFDEAVSDLKSDLTQETNARTATDNALSARITDNDTDISALQTNVTNLGTHKVAQPLDGNNQPTNGTSGQSLRTKGDGTTEWASVGLPTDEQTAQAVSDWLDAHPEATTTVADGSLTEAKFTSGLKLKSIKDYITPQMYGAAGDGTTDDTTAMANAIADAITKGTPVLIPQGSTIRIASTINLTGYVSLIIEGTLYADGCDGIRVLGIRNQIGGNGKIQGSGTHIGVLFGGANKTDYSNYNIIEGVSIDSFDIGISLYNDQQNDLTVYFDIITNLNIDHCRIGIGFYGFADAILVSKIIFTDCGSNDVSGGAFVFKKIGDQYPLDNSISQIFHHQSPSAITLNIEKVSFSQFSGIVCEQGGSSAKSLVITDDTSTGNQFYLTSNTYAYRTIPNDCFKRNVFIDVSGDIAANRLSLQGNLSTEGNFTFRGSTEIQEMAIRKRFVKTGIAERTDVELLQVKKLALNYPIVFKVRCLVSSTVATVALRKYAEAIILYQGVTSANVRLLDNYGSVDIAVTNDGSVTVNSGDNGTSTTNGFMLLEIEQISDNREKLDLLRYTVGEGFTEM